jgi:hypothetical protein
MTTKVTIRNEEQGSSHKIIVGIMDGSSDDWVSRTVLDIGEEQTFIIWGSQNIVVTEMPTPKPISNDNGAAATVVIKEPVEEERMVA